MTKKQIKKIFMDAGIWDKKYSMELINTIYEYHPAWLFIENGYMRIWFPKDKFYQELIKAQKAKSKKP